MCVCSSVCVFKLNTGNGKNSAAAADKHNYDKGVGGAVGWLVRGPISRTTI